MTTIGRPGSAIPTQLTAAQLAVLDDPVWHALVTSHAHLALGTAGARCYPADITAFAAVQGDSVDGWAALHELVGDGAVVVTARAGGSAPPQPWQLVGGGPGFQMILHELADVPRTDATIQPLTTQDIAQMLALVELTQPGPFRAGTIHLGDYFGVFEGNRLIAMAGERMQTPDLTEISAVCTHPDARGKGLAAAISHHVATHILARGQTPILHVADTNVNAKRVYERLGFTVRGQLQFQAFRVPGGAK